MSCESLLFPIEFWISQIFSVYWQIDLEYIISKQRMLKFLDISLSRIWKSPLVSKFADRLLEQGCILSPLISECHNISINIIWINIYNMYNTHCIYLLIWWAVCGVMKHPRRPFAALELTSFILTALSYTVALRAAFCSQKYLQAVVNSEIVILI